jgi:hypothetical protein
MPVGLEVSPGLLCGQKLGTTHRNDEDCFDVDMYCWAPSSCYR